MFLLSGKEYIGRKRKTPSNDIINPPIVPAAKGYQNALLSVPTIKGMKPRMVDKTVSRMGIIFALHALT
jgi:hypothetical protein